MFSKEHFIPRIIKKSNPIFFEDSTCIIRYDNETGKGDHRHLRNREEPYLFKDVETLVADFLEDIESERGK